MKVKHKDLIIELYDSIEDLPVTRFQAYNLNLLLDGGIGSDMNAFNRHINKISQMIKVNPDSAIRQLKNMQENIRFIMTKTSPEMKSFVVMIKKIDDRKIDDSDLSEDGVKDIIDELGKKELPFSLVRKTLNTIKKNLDFEFDTFFPNLSDSVKMKEFYSFLKKRTSLVLKYVKNSETILQKQIDKIDEFFLMNLKPNVYGGAEGLEVTMIKGFEDTCNTLNNSGLTTESRNMTTLTFYKTLETVQKIIKEREKAAKKKK